MNALPRLILKPFPILLTVQQYLVRTAEDSNKYLTAAQIGVIIFSFGATTGPRPLFLVLTAVLSALALRDKFALHALGTPQEGSAPLAKYYVASCGDAITCLLFMVAAELLAVKYAPSMALPSSALYHGAVFCIPLIAMLRMVLRPMPEPDPSYQSSSPRSAIYLFWRTCLFNLLWLLTFWGLVVMDVTDDPHSKLDVLRGFAPIETFGLLIMFGRNGLLRRHTLLSILVCWKTQRLIRFKEMLLHVVKKGDPFYHVAVFLEALLFIELAVSMLDGGWPPAGCGAPARVRHRRRDVEVSERGKPDCSRVASVRD